jgi:hypothetical protein
MGWRFARSGDGRSDQACRRAMAVFLHWPMPVADGHEEPFTVVVR